MFEYEAKKKAEQRKVEKPSKLKMGYDGAASSSDDGFVGKGKQKIPFSSGGIDLKGKER